MTEATAAEPRTWIVDWEAAARTSAEALGLEIAPVRITRASPQRLDALVGGLPGPDT